MIKRLWENLKNLTALYKRVEKVEENLRNNNALVQQAEETQRGGSENLRRIEENLRNNNEMLKQLQDINRRLSVLEENVNNNNVLIGRLSQLSDQDQIKAIVNAMKLKVDRVTARMDELQEGAGVRGTEGAGICSAEGAGTCGTTRPALNAASAPAMSAQPKDRYGQIDYFDFENHFRGSRELIKKRQSEYLKYFAGRSRVVDLGCGRGEFLELLAENDIKAQGVDFYEEFVLYCKEKNLDVVEGDAIDYLEKIEKTDGIFAGQLVEHLTVGQMIALCEKAYEKLEEGAYLIMETPNPMSLAIYTHAFYLDPSHQKPVHPLMLQYLARKAGFSKVEILFTEGSRPEEQIPQLHGTGSVEEDAFNENMKVMAQYLYGSQDYAIIAQK